MVFIMLGIHFNFTVREGEWQGYDCVDKGDGGGFSTLLLFVCPQTNVLCVHWQTFLSTHSNENVKCYTY